MSDKTVRVIADENGNVIRQSKNPDFGYVVVKQERIVHKRGWINSRERTALIKGTIDLLKKQKYRKNGLIEGNIVTYETTEPLDRRNPEYGLKYAGDTGIVCCTADGEAIYRETYYDITGQDSDTLVAHANGAEISAANRSTMQTNDAVEETTNKFADMNEDETPELTDDLMEQGEKVALAQDEDSDNEEEIEQEIEEEIEEEEEEFEL